MRRWPFAWWWGLAVLLLASPTFAQSWIYSSAAERVIENLLLRSPVRCCKITDIYNAAGSVHWTFPTTDGTSGQAIITNGSGVLSFGTATGSAPVGATYVTLTTNATLTNERVLTGTASQVTITDNGAGSTVVVSLPATINVNTSGNAATASVAPAGALTGTTLNATVTASSFTSVGVLTSLSLSGPIVSGSYIELQQQSAPTTPSGAARFFVDTSNRFAWIGSNGFVRTFDGTANTASRVYVLPDASDIIAVLTAAQAFTNKTYNGMTLTSTTGTFTLANGKTATVSNTLTFTGTDGSSVAFGAGGTVLYSGGALGTPSSGVATNLTGLPLTTGVAGVLPIANGGTNDTGSAWTTYTPTITCTTSGSVTTSTRQGAYKTIGKTTHVAISILVTTLGTCLGAITATLPVTAVTRFEQTLAGMESAITGKGLRVYIGSGGTLLNMRYSDATIIWVDGVTLIAGGTYEGA